MKNSILKLVSFGLLILMQTQVSAQDIYLKTFGEKAGIPLIFLHGGPGYNCASFEVTTAQTLAESGYFVIVYDRRGEGRSANSKAEYTFEQSQEDLSAIMDSFGIEKANLIGHSFGGMLAVNFAEQHADKVESILLVGAPMDLQASFKTIITSCEAIYENKNDQTNLYYINMLKNMDTTSVQYSSYCFLYAMQNGFYSPKQTTEEAKSLYGLFRTDTTLMQHASKMEEIPPSAFLKNEQYTSINLESKLEILHKNGTKLFGFYGKEDGLYSAQQIKDLENIIGSEQLKYFDNCSHSVFIDQQKAFISALNSWLKP